MLTTKSPKGNYGPPSVLALLYRQATVDCQHGTRIMTVGRHFRSIGDPRVSRIPNTHNEHRRMIESLPCHLRGQTSRALYPQACFGETLHGELYRERIDHSACLCVCFFHNSSIGRLIDVDRPVACTQQTSHPSSSVDNHFLVSHLSPTDQAGIVTVQQNKGESFVCWHCQFLLVSMMG